MDKKQYFTDLYTLFEASAGMAGGPEVMSQENIADTGMDVTGGMPTQQDPTMMTGDPTINMQDPNMLAMPQDSMNMEPSVNSESSLVIEKEKFKKLFDLFEDLITYSDVFTDNIKMIDINLLDEQIFANLRRYTDDIQELNKKLKNYLLNFFNNEEYEKVLYAYVLFRTEMITAIKGLRRILDLDHPDRELDWKK